MSQPKIFDAPLKVINIGLESFATDLAEDQVEVQHVDWRPPSGGDPRLAALLAGLSDDD